MAEKLEKVADTTAKPAKAPAKKAPAKKEAAPIATPNSAKPLNRVQEQYKNEVIPQMIKTFNYKNINEVPKLVKIVVNTGLGDVKDNPKAVQTAVKELETITGQKAVSTKAKKSVANFKVRKDMVIGAKVDLRGERMYQFFDKLVSIALPRVRDFKGVSPKSFDGRGNYALGVKEQLIFPEISYDQVDVVRGFDICVVTTAKTDDEARELIKLLGMPFARN
ncbi:MAG: 50S ribosomal protein L5 [Clostridia bacterium]